MANGDSQILKFLKDYWFLILALVAVVGGYVRHDILITEIQTNRQGEIEQWRRINANEDLANELNGRVKEIEKHVTVEAVQKWGALQSTVAEDHQTLKDHLRNHP